MGNEDTDDDEYIYTNCTVTCAKQIVTPLTTGICGKKCDAQTKSNGQHPNRRHHCPECGEW